LIVYFDRLDMRFSQSKKKQHIIRLSLNFTKTKYWIFHFQKLKLKVLQLKIRKQCNLKEKDKSGVETKRRRIGHQSHIKALSTSCTTLKEILCRDDSNGTKEGRHRSSKEATLAFLMQRPSSHAYAMQFSF